jgi:hypothetical protein
MQGRAVCPLALFTIADSVTRHRAIWSGTFATWCLRHACDAHLPSLRLGKEGPFAHVPD